MSPHQYRFLGPLFLAALQVLTSLVLLTVRPVLWCPSWGASADSHSSLFLCDRSAHLPIFLEVPLAGSSVKSILE